MSFKVGALMSFKVGALMSFKVGALMSFKVRGKTFYGKSTKIRILA